MSVEVTNLKEVIRSLKAAGVEVTDLRSAMKEVAAPVVEEAQRRAPKVSGALAASIRPSNTANKAIIRAGSAKVPYAAVQEYGWKRRNIKASNFLHGAADAKQHEVIEALRKVLDDLADKYGLN